MIEQDELSPDFIQNLERSGATKSYIRAALDSDLRIKYWRRRRRWQTATSVITALAALLTAAGTVIAARISLEASREATTQRDLAISRMLTAQALGVKEDDKLAGQLALAAYYISPNKEALEALLTNTLRTESSPVGINATSAVFDSDGSAALVAGDRQPASYISVGQNRATPLGSTRDSGSSVAFKGNSAFAAVSDASRVNLWDLSIPLRPRKVATMTGNRSAVDEISFSPDGTTLAIGHRTGNTTLWDVSDPSSARMISTVDGDNSPIRAISFSPDGRLLIEGGPSGRLSIWDITDNGSPYRVADLATDIPITTLAVSRDGDTVAVGGATGQIQVRTIRNRPYSQRVWQVRSSNGKPLNDVAFSPSGDTLATAGPAGATSLYSATTGEPTQIILGSAGILAVKFLQTESSVLTIDANGVVRKMATTPQAAKDEICRDPSSRISATEWASWVPDVAPYNPPCSG